MSPKTNTKPLLVGESNPYGGDPYFALYPAPDGCSGHRLCSLVLGMRRTDYLEAFDRCNLCDGTWNLQQARKMATKLICDRMGRAKIILLGSKVCSAFGVPFLPFAVADEILLRLPHPSGLCREWAKPGAVARAREAVSAFVPEVSPLLGIG